MGRAMQYPPGTLEHLQDEERSILAVVDTLCRNNHIDYFIDSGTCLGAARHGGFIPWDDDVDIAMPYTEYLRFLELAPRLLPAGYTLHTCSNTPGFSALWAKVFKDGTRFVDEASWEAGCDQAIFLDVFPYFPLEKNPNKAHRQRMQCRRLQEMSYLHCIAHPKVPSNTSLRKAKQLGCSVVHHTIARAWKPEKLAEALLSTAEPSEPGEYWFDAVYPLGSPRRATALFPTRDISFDNLTLRAPNDVHDYLSTMYGNWHELPPEEERYTHLPLILDFGDGINVMEMAA